MRCVIEARLPLSPVALLLVLLSMPALSQASPDDVRLSDLAITTEENAAIQSDPAAVTFTDIGAGLPGVSYSSAAWGDYDNDGDLDILMTGNTDPELISRVYENDAGAFTDIEAGLQGVGWSSVAWGDYDNDGDLDILLTGNTASGSISRIYENDAGSFADIGAALEEVSDASVAWGDYDNDGDLDILLTGWSGSVFISRVYENDVGSFTDIGAGLPGVTYSSAAWGDYDNDGDLDILLTGHTTSMPISSVYMNVAGGFFDIGAWLEGVYMSSAAWGDYDNDGDLDILMTGLTGTAAISRVYENDGATSNTAPAAPSNLSFSHFGNVGTFSWDAATDAETPSVGLTYNLRIGTTPGGNEICSSMADSATGYRRVVQMGNTNHNTTWAITLPDPLPPWAYWSVQAVDGAFEGSAFAAEQSSNIITLTDIGAGLPGLDFSSVAWGDYDNDGDLDALLTGRMGYAPFSRIYENDAGSFTDIGAGLPEVGYASVAWGDYDNDSDLDILLAGHTGHGVISRVYENDGGSFTDIGAGLAGVCEGSSAWGDYDNDGDLDILMTGRAEEYEPISCVYENDAGSFADIAAGLPGVSYSSAAWGDYDNDGDLDILLTGNAGLAGAISLVYENDGGSFTDIGAGLPGVDHSSVAWGDYDSDGDLDILMTGNTSLTDSVFISRVYENDAGSFTDIAAGLPGVSYGSAAWGDYDNDGDLDVLLTGDIGPTGISRVYANDAGTFTDIGAGLPGVRWNFAGCGWSDYDNDGDLDILLTGSTGSTQISRVYESEGATANTAPSPPSNLACDVVGHVGTFSWDGSTDAETPSAGLTYNLRVGTTPGGEEISAGMADSATGYRRVVQLGNTNHNTTWTITLPVPPPPLVYWSVQAVDGAFEGSTFAAEQAISVITFTDIGAGLPGVGESAAAWGDYDNDGDLDILLTGGAGAEWISRIYENDAGSFTDTGAGLPAVYRGSVAWGDYDNDGDLDILLTGYTGAEYISRVYENDAGTFTDIAAGLVGVGYSSAAWGDYDNDGDLDIFLTGSIGGGYLTSRVYENDAGSFTDIGAGLPDVNRGSAAWGDYDNDGDLDVLLTGNTGSVGISRVYENDAGSFTDMGAGLTGVFRGSAAWGDYDNDGDLDILLTGFTGSEPISRVYENDGGSFADIGVGLPGVSYSSAAWGDYDSDGDLDILLTGNTVLERISRIYENEAESFTDIGAGLTGVSIGSSVWGDYDNDGDLDVLLAGLTGTELISRVYESEGATSNTAPSAPSNLSFSLDGNVGTFTWDAATDAETPSAGLTYNLRIGTTPGGDEICAGMADSTSGYRRVVQMGNSNHNTTWAITLPDSLPPWAYWSVQAVDGAFEGSGFALTDTILLGATGVSDPADDVLPVVFRLYPSAPNPFNPRTTIRYDLPTQAPVRMVIYDAAGRLVRTLVDEPAHPPGRHEAIWDGTNAAGQGVASGVYFCRMESGDFREVRKMALVR